MHPEVGRDGRGVDAPTAIAAASFLLALNQLAVNIQPLLLGALADGYGLTDRQLGHVSAVFVGFTSIATLSAPWWVRRVNWRKFSFFALVGAIVAMSLGAIASTLGALLILFAALGMFKGFLGAPSFVSLGDTANPDRSYGISVAAQASLSAIIAIPVAAYIIPAHGASGLFATLAFLLGCGLLVLPWLPRNGRQAATAKIAGAPLVAADVIPALLAFLALVLFLAGILGFWYFMERIGVARGVSPYIIGIAVSSCSISTIFSAMVVAWLGGRFPSLVFIVAGTAAIVAGYALLKVDGDMAFVVGANMFAVGWGLAQPSYWAELRKRDSTGRLFVVAPASSGAAGVLIGMAAGPVIEQTGYNGLLVFSSLLLVFGVVVILGAQLVVRWRARIAGTA